MSNYDIVEDEFLHKNIEHIANRSLQNDKETKVMLEKIACVLKKGFKLIPTKKRVKMLEEQRKQIEETEKCYKTD